VVGVAVVLIADLLDRVERRLGGGLGVGARGAGDGVTDLPGVLDDADRVTIFMPNRRWYAGSPISALGRTERL